CLVGLLRPGVAGPVAARRPGPPVTAGSVRGFHVRSASMADWSAHVVSVSDGVYHGSRADDSGDALAEMLVGAGATSVSRSVVPAGEDRIRDAILAAAAASDLAVTTCGTGPG